MVRKYTRPSEVCDVCGQFRYRKDHDHEACSKVRAERYKIWLDQPAGWRSNPTVTNRQAIERREKAAAKRRAALQAGSRSEWTPE